MSLNKKQELSITNKTRVPVPRALFQRAFRIAVKNNIIEISAVFVGDHTMQALNKTYRKKDAPTNVLAFPIADNAGEIVINVNRAVREAVALGISRNERMAYLFTHGLLHLLGYDHTTDRDAVKMEKEEERIMKKLET